MTVPSDIKTRFPLLFPAAWLAALAGLAFAGCVELEQTLRLQPDGSLTFSLHYTVPEDALPQLAAAQQAIEGWQGGDAKTPPDSLQWIFNRKLATAFFSRDGLELTRYDQAIRDGRAVVDIAGRATDGMAALRSGRLGPLTIAPDAVGNVVLRMALAADDGVAARNEPQRAAELQQLCKGLKLVLVISCPTDVVDSSGERVNSRESRWVFDADKTPDFLLKTPVIQLAFKPTDAWKE